MWFRWLIVAEGMSVFFEIGNKGDLAKREVKVCGSPEHINCSDTAFQIYKLHIMKYFIFLR